MRQTRVQSDLSPAFEAWRFRFGRTASGMACQRPTQETEPCEVWFRGWAAVFPINRALRAEKRD
ncbi:hypothetical protein KL86PLE_60357 [uncultured Pleomorphomonas sp.]|uniref:Uncharacterized protein n=1 Tax=uncultured Pleomorphomonas sp. TaxID=442121 RepID=A0A212LKG3_9HYPH|nr:hypothetical protein KL86PLE_60357 [uncultured Pleomorphomonas sp.]